MNFDFTFYSFSVDVWSLGCIFGYMLTNKHVFRKRGEERGEIEGTMQRVFEILGSPPKSFADLVIEVACNFVIRGGGFRPKTLEDRF